VLAANERRILERLSDDDLVLDVGGWGDPFPRADWVLDVMPYETRGLYERRGWVERRPSGAARFDASRWVQRDLCAREPFPFEDGHFDYVICAQTLEDLRDPVWVCQEMCRIGKAGYVEVPSRLEEQSFGVEGPWVGWGHHRWLTDVRPGELEFVAKPHGLHAFPDCHFPPGFWQALSPEDRVESLWWEGGFAARERLLIEPDPYTSYLPEFVAEELRRRPLPRRRIARRLRNRVARKLMW
jgi:hypothetical protein